MSLIIIIILLFINVILSVALSFGIALPNPATIKDWGAPVLWVSGLSSIITTLVASASLLMSYRNTKKDNSLKNSAIFAWLEVIEHSTTGNTLELFIRNETILPIYKWKIDLPCIEKSLVIDQKAYGVLTPGIKKYSLGKLSELKILDINDLRLTIEFTTSDQTKMKRDLNGRLQNR